MAYSLSYPVDLFQGSTRSLYALMAALVLIADHWNLIAPILRSTDNGTDRNISIVSGWNLIGHSAETALDISTITFTNTSGNTTTWADSITQKKIYGYLAYYDSTPATAGNRKYKYAATSGVDTTQLTADKGYWLNARQAGTLTLPSAGGTINTSTFAYNKLRFQHSNGTQLNITDAQSAVWWSDYIQYWDTDNDTFRYVCSDIYSGRGGPSVDIYCLADSLNPWHGYFIWSNYNNITLIRQN